ncbi:radical SAM protein [bacterium]|nr:radical SAM protein [bacterium]
MKIAVITLHRSRLKFAQEYYAATVKIFLEQRAAGHSVDAVDLFMSDDAGISAKLLENSGYGVVLFRMLHWNKEVLMNIINKMKGTTAKIGVWGHDSFSYPEEYLKKGVNFIISDEPELSLYEFVSAIAEGANPGNAAGIVYRDDAQKTYLYGEHRVLPEIDLIPSPYITGEIEVGPEVAVFWEIARGCLFKCDFCVEFSHNASLRYHSFAYLEKELKLFAMKGVREIIWGAPIANFSHQHLKKIFDLIRQYIPEIIITMQIRPDILTHEEIEYLSEMNVYINLGVQSFNQKVLENMLTSINVEKTLATIRSINNFPALSFGIDIIGGLPRLSYQDFMDDVEQAFYLWPINISVRRLSLYPGTRLHNRIRELDYTVDPAYPYCAISSETISKRELERVEEIGDAVELLYNRGRMVAVFTIISEALDHRAVEVVERWVKWARKQELTFDDETPFDVIYPHIETFFHYMFDRFQKKKLWPLAQDLLKHNYHYTQSLTTIDTDIQTLPYLLPSINGETKIGINKSALVDKYSFNIEDVVESGYINIKSYTEDMYKETSTALIYRLDDGIFTRIITNAEGKLFQFIHNSGATTVAAIAKKFPQDDIVDLIQLWCDEGVLYIDIS